MTNDTIPSPPPDMTDLNDQYDEILLPKPAKTGDRTFLGLYWTEFKDNELKVNLLPEGDVKTSLTAKILDLRSLFELAYKVVDGDEDGCITEIFDDVEIKIDNVRMGVRGYLRSV